MPPALVLGVLLTLVQGSSQILPWDTQPPPPPPSCRCDQDLNCVCSRAGLNAVPSVPDRTRTLALDFNQIAEIRRTDLGGLRELQVLTIHANMLSRIDRWAFSSLWSLKELDLSQNLLTALDQRWFNKLGALESLKLHSNPYKCLGSSPFRTLYRLRVLSFGGESLEEIRATDLKGLGGLEQLRVDANNLKRYDPGTLAQLWPLDHVTLGIRSPFMSNQTLASELIRDVSNPETRLTLENIYLNDNCSALPLKEVARKRTRHLMLQNFFLTDDSIVKLLKATDGAPLVTLSLNNATIVGLGRFQNASRTDLKVEEFYAKDLQMLNNFQYESFLPLKDLLIYLRKISLINAKVFLMPCLTSVFLKNLEYLDFSENLLTDPALLETLCAGAGVLRDLRVLNLSANSIKSLPLISRMVMNLSKLSHLDVSRNSLNVMPRSCSWPQSLRFLNLSRTKLTSVTSCLPRTLQILDLSHNDLEGLALALPALRELHLSGNKLLMLPPGRLFPSLQTLTVQLNGLNLFSRSDLLAFPRLQYLKAGLNKYICSCDFVPFFHSLSNGETNVTLTDGANSYACDTPLHLQGAPLLLAQRSFPECRHVLFVFISCGAVLVFLVFWGVLLWKLHAFWYLKMIVVWLKAKHQRRRRQRQEDGDLVRLLLTFDAFVSYSERDSAWVDNYLLPELEQTGFSAESRTESSAEFVNESSPESKPESSPESKPESSPESKPESSPESKPESSPESKPESSPESKPESSPESKPESSPESKPESSPESKPESRPSPESTSSLSPESRSSPESESRPSPESRSGLSPRPEPLKLCLHRRDFLPGRWIMDNIVMAIESSRRTLFILSHNFVRSEWCKYELDFTHFQLLEGNCREDAAILVLLEPLSHDDVPKRFCRLRKLLSSTTYLQWPQDPEQRDQFWTSLRQALKPDQDH